MEFIDKVAAITGCAGGLGLAIARRLAASGARIVALDRDAASCDRAVSALVEAGFSDAVGVAADVASSRAVESAFAEIDHRVGRLDILVNCAGVREVKSVIDLEAEEWDRVIAINLSGPFYCTKEAARRMRHTGGGSIINISSVAAFMGMPHRPAYNASKAGLAGLTRNLAKDLAPMGIRVNAVAPGLLRTDLTEAYFKDAAFVDGLQTIVPLGGAGGPDDVANAVRFLCSPMSKFITGVVLPVDGGWSAEKGYTVGAGPSPYTSASSST